MEWLVMENGEACANEILNDIDRRLVHCGLLQLTTFKTSNWTDFRLAAVPPFLMVIVSNNGQAMTQKL